MAGNSHIKKCRLYFYKVLDINFNEIDLIWGKITDIQKIRNIIIHNDGNIIKEKDKKIEKQELYKIIKNYPDIELDYDGDLIIKNSKVLYEFCDIVKKCLIEIWNLIDDKF